LAVLRNALNRRTAACIALPFAALAVLATTFRAYFSEIISVLAAAAPVQSTVRLPLGLVLPARLETPISLKDAQKGRQIEARLMQEVPLPDHGKIPAKSLVKGSILSITKDPDGQGSDITLTFVQVNNSRQDFSMTASLRAIASYEVVRAAQVPFTGADTGSPPGWANTVQIGGDVRYGDGGPVRNRQKITVGKAVIGGVLVHLHANPQYGCEGPINGDDHLQALWLFSADACGYYGMSDFEISHDGASDPLGEITLHFEKDNGKLGPGTGLLLRVLPRPNP
jgi:hypothetical protein